MRLLDTANYYTPLEPASLLYPREYILSFEIIITARQPYDNLLANTNCAQPLAKNPDAINSLASKSYLSIQMRTMKKFLCVEWRAPEGDAKF